MKNKRVFDMFERTSIQEVQDSSFRDQNFSISPELTNYDSRNLKMQKLNEDSHDSLNQENLVNNNQSFDKKPKNKN